VKFILLFFFLILSSCKDGNLVDRTAGKTAKVTSSTSSSDGKGIEQPSDLYDLNLNYIRPPDSRTLYTLTANLLLNGKQEQSLSSGVVTFYFSSSVSGVPDLFTKEVSWRGGKADYSLSITDEFPETFYVWVGSTIKDKAKLSEKIKFTWEKVPLSQTELKLSTDAPVYTAVASVTPLAQFYQNGVQVIPAYAQADVYTSYDDKVCDLSEITSIPDLSTFGVKKSSATFSSSGLAFSKFSESKSFYAKVFSSYCAKSPCSASAMKPMVSNCLQVTVLIHDEPKPTLDAILNLSNVKIPEVTFVDSSNKAQSDVFVSAELLRGDCQSSDSVKVTFTPTNTSSYTSDISSHLLSNPTIKQWSLKLSGSKGGIESDEICTEFTAPSSSAGSPVDHTYAVNLLSNQESIKLSFGEHFLIKMSTSVDGEFAEVLGAKSLFLSSECQGQASSTKIAMTPGSVLFSDDIAVEGASYDYKHNASLKTQYAWVSQTILGKEYNSAGCLKIINYQADKLILSKTHHEFSADGSELSTSFLSEFKSLDATLEKSPDQLVHYYYSVSACYSTEDSSEMVVENSTATILTGGVKKLYFWAIGQEESEAKELQSNCIEIIDDRSTEPESQELTMNLVPLASQVATGATLSVSFTSNSEQKPFNKSNLVLDILEGECSSTTVLKTIPGNILDAEMSLSKEYALDVDELLGLTTGKTISFKLSNGLQSGCYTGELVRDPKLPDGEGTTTGDPGTTTDGEGTTTGDPGTTTDGEGTTTGDPGTTTDGEGTTTGDTGTTTDGEGTEETPPDPATFEFSLVEAGSPMVFMSDDTNSLYRGGRFTLVRQVDRNDGKGFVPELGNSLFVRGVACDPKLGQHFQMAENNAINIYNDTTLQNPHQYIWAVASFEGQEYITDCAEMYHLKANKIILAQKSLIPTYDEDSESFSAKVDFTGTLNLYNKPIVSTLASEQPLSIYYASTCKPLSDEKTLIGEVDHKDGKFSSADLEMTEMQALQKIYMWAEGVEVPDSPLFLTSDCLSYTFPSAPVKQVVASLNFSLDSTTIDESMNVEVEYLENDIPVVFSSNSPSLSIKSGLCSSTGGSSLLTLSPMPVSSATSKSFLLDYSVLASKIASSGPISVVVTMGTLSKCEEATFVKLENTLTAIKVFPSSSDKYFLTSTKSLEILPSFTAQINNIGTAFKSNLIFEVCSKMASAASATCKEIPIGTTTYTASTVLPNVLISRDLNKIGPENITLQLSLKSNPTAKIVSDTYTVFHTQLMPGSDTSMSITTLPDIISKTYSLTFSFDTISMVYENKTFNTSNKPYYISEGVRYYTSTSSCFDANATLLKSAMVSGSKTTRYEYTQKIPLINSTADRTYYIWYALREDDQSTLWINSQACKKIVIPKATTSGTGTNVPISTI
jgi:hypothetical protein